MQTCQKSMQFLLFKVIAMKPFPTNPAKFPILPIHVAHAIQLDFYTDMRNVIDIWLPEGYGKPPHHCLILSYVEDRRFFYGR